MTTSVHFKILRNNSSPGWKYHLLSASNQLLATSIETFRFKWNCRLAIREQRRYATDKTWFMPDNRTESIGFAIINSDLQGIMQSPVFLSLEERDLVIDTIIGSIANARVQ